MDAKPYQPSIGQPAKFNNTSSNGWSAETKFDLGMKCRTVGNFPAVVSEVTIENFQDPEGMRALSQESQNLTVSL